MPYKNDKSSPCYGRGSVIAVTKLSHSQMSSVIGDILSYI